MDREEEEAGRQAHLSVVDTPQEMLVSVGGRVEVKVDPAASTELRCQQDGWMDVARRSARPVRRDLDPTAVSMVSAVQGKTWTVYRVGFVGGTRCRRRDVERRPQGAVYRVYKVYRVMDRMRQLGSSAANTLSAVDGMAAPVVSTGSRGVYRS